VNSSEKVKTVIAREEGLPLPPPSSGEGSALRREIPKNHEYDLRALRPLARALFSSAVALGHAVTAYKEFTRIKSSSISPDGMLGGKGYVLRVKEIRSKLQSACEELSAITDTLHDELHAPHWKKDAEGLGEEEAEDVAELLEETDEVLEDPERYGDKELKEIEGAPKTKGMKDKIKEEEDKDHKGDASSLPGGGSQETSQARPPGEASKHKEATDWKTPSAWARFANSSLPVNTLPGPRVDHLDRGEQTGPGGSYNRDEPPVEDDWGRTDGVDDEYVYRSEQENELNRTSTLPLWGESGLPADTETRTEARDFGVGFGAKGEGSEGYGTTSPDGRGVWGPQSGLPHDPTAPTKDPSGGSIPYQDGMSRNFWGTVSESELPFDGPDPVARSDYYDGNKGNQFNLSLHGESGLPGTLPDAKPTPVTPRPSHLHEHMFADSGLPGDEGVPYSYDKDLPNVGEKYERQDVPYIKYDDSVHDNRNDTQDLYRMDNNG
jgi:hypothetical protein